MSVVFYFKQKTAYEMRISDWSSYVCSSDRPWTLDERARTPSTAWAFYAANGETWLTKSFFSTICNFLSPGWIKRPSAVVVDMRDAKPRPGSRSEESCGGKAWVRQVRSRWRTYT